ncbi:MAG: hypothetical protein LC793_13055 [Thermomicrobia bacterium]|nr:hypothetical protein [Thermomicrobia bacterium]
MRRNEAEYTIIFDGGARGNPGEGYGSYELRTGTHREIVRLTFGNNVTNNEAEYQSDDAPRPLQARRRAMAAPRDERAHPRPLKVRFSQPPGHSGNA